MTNVFDKQTTARLFLAHDAVAKNPLMLGGTHFGGVCEWKAAWVRHQLDHGGFEGGVVAIVPVAAASHVIPTDIYGHGVSYRLAPEEADETQGQRPWQEVDLRWNCHAIAATTATRIDGGSEVVVLTPSECVTPVRLSLYLATMVAPTGIQWRYFSGKECAEIYSAPVVPLAEDTVPRKVRIGIDVDDARGVLKEVRARLSAMYNRYGSAWQPPTTGIKLRDPAFA